MHSSRRLGVGTLLLAVAGISGVAGSLLGTVFGHQMAGHQGTVGHGYTPLLEQCWQLAAEQTPQDLAGYRVEYRPVDRRFAAGTVYDPGRYIGIGDRLRPIHF